MISNELKELINKAILFLDDINTLNQATVNSATACLKQVVKQYKYEIEISDSLENNGSDIVKKVWLLNSIDYDDYTIDHYIQSTNGKIYEQKGYRISNYLTVPKDVTEITIVSPMDGGNGYHVGAFYDKDKNFLKGINTHPDSEYTFPQFGNNVSVTYKLPEGTEYLRLGSSSASSSFNAYCYTKLYTSNDSFIHESNKSYTVDTVKDMKHMDLKTGDIVNTLGYYEVNDLGKAKYEIMSYEEWRALLPSDVILQTNSAGYIHTVVDEYGNHTLNNGLVAKLVLDINNIKPEQWGAKGDGVFNDCPAFVHMFAQVKTGKIVFNKDGVYSLGLIHEDDTVKTFKDNPYKSYMTGGLLGGQFYSKPIMANIHDVEFIGNGAKITIPDGVFGSGGMGILNFAGDVRGLKIHDLNFDGKGRTIWSPNKNSNHTIFYAPATINVNHELIKDIHPLYVKETDSYTGGKLLDLEIYNCNFFDAGAMLTTAGDSGGDFILIINPEDCHGINIHDNTFKAWGRWVFAIDLGGNGERITNIIFANNVCVGANANHKDEEGNTIFNIPTPDGGGLKQSASYEDKWRWRALGFIDFEARKCFSNVKLVGNHIDGSSGWAINGNGRITNNVLIKNNYWNHCGGGYPYTLEFYSGYAENWTIEENEFPGVGGFKLGLCTKDLYIRNNLGSPKCRMFGIEGEIVYENNKKRPEDTSNYHVGMELDGGLSTSFPGIEESDRKAHLVFKNNDYGIYGRTAWNKKYITFDITDNKFDAIDISNFYHNEFDFSQLTNSNGTMKVIGFKAITPLPTFGTKAVIPMAYHEAGSTIFSDMGNIGCLNAIYFNDYRYLGISEEDYEKGKNSFGIFSFNAYKTYKGYKGVEMLCTRSGILPSGGRYGFENDSSPYSDYGTMYKTIKAGSYIYTEDNMYYCSSIISGGTGVLGEAPTHSSGSQLCGECVLDYVDKLARITLKESK